MITLNGLEKLEQEAHDKGIDIVERDFGERLKGLYCDNNIGLNKNISTKAEKTCVLAEELGHHHTSVGDIIDLSVAQNRKQERQARLWAYNQQIGLSGLIRAYQHKCQDSSEIADFLEVTEQFLLDAIQCYKEKYGICTICDNYIIYFIPMLAVMEKYRI